VQLCRFVHRCRALDAAALHKHAARPFCACRQGTDSARDLVQPCNSNCSCATVGAFYPVCGSDGRSYFNPCFAGCAVSTSTESFSECACVQPSGVGAVRRVSAGYCSSAKCGKLALAGFGIWASMFLIFAGSHRAAAACYRVFCTVLCCYSSLQGTARPWPW
jgi:hypothetical protein